MTELLLIDSVKRHEAIYNSKCTEYRDGVARHAAWISIAELCGSTVGECKDSWVKLRNCYTNAKKRRIRKSGHKLDPWRFEEEMSFLDPYLKERPLLEDVEVTFVEDTWEKGSSTKRTESPGTNRITASLEREHLLIDLIRRYEVIYNTQCGVYRDPKERHAAWVEIADLHGSTVAKCKEVWIKLRNCYTNALKRQQVRNAKKLPTTPWRFEKQMSFLRPYLNMRYKKNKKIQNNSEAILYDEDSWEAFSSPKNMLRPNSDVTRSAHKRKASSTDFFEALRVDAEENTPELIYDSQELDGMDHFFLSMSKMTKNLPKKDQLRIKLDLHKAINEAELKQLDQTDGCTANDGDSGESSEVKQEVLSPGVHVIEECEPEEIEYLSYD